MQPNDEPEVPTQGAEPLDIARLWALCEAATAGPWKRVADAVREPKWTHIQDVQTTSGRLLVADADFVIAARTALPDALREIASLHEQVAAAKKALAEESNAADQLRSQLYAVDEVLIINWVGPRKDGDYRKALADLITTALREHDDPLISEVARERLNERLKERDDLKAQLEQARADGAEETKRLDWLIEHGDWHKPGTDIYGKHYMGEWTRHDGRGCDDAITPKADDPRQAIDAARAPGGEGM